MNTYLRGARTIVCIGCKLRRRTKNPTIDICRRCESSGVDASLPSEGKAEQTLREQLSQLTDSYGRPLYLQYRVYREGVCSVCSNTGPIYEEPAALCRTCHQKKLTRLGKAALKVKVECDVCKKMRRSVCLSEDICLADYLARKNGYGTCIGCGKEKQIWVKKNGARCRYCYKNYCARQSLMKFVDEYRGLNRDHFNDLIATIDMNNVDEKLNRRMRAFGKFFQTLTLPVPLTWESIEEAMPALGSKKVNRVNTISMRSCLLDLAHLLVARGLLEKKEDYLARRRLQHNIALAPARFREPVRSYTGWLAKLKNSPATALSNLVSLNPFLWWCEARDIKSPQEVNPHIFEEYEQFLTWHWICDGCENILPFDVFAEIPACDSCKAVDSMRKTRRHSHASVQKDRGMVRHFFRWAEITGIGPNPVGIPVQGNSALRHYSDDVIERLVEYLISPDAQPLEAVVFYLTIFHAFSTWELTHAMLPTGDTYNPSLVRGLSDAYYVFLPARPPTRHNHRPGRPEGRVDFPVSAAPWLKPLLQRYERWRTDTLDNPTNRFLLVAPGRARHDNPVCVEFVRRVVKRGSARAGVGECNPKRLRGTAAVSLTDSGVIGVLTALGWSASQGFKFTWHERREVEPRSKPEDLLDEPSSARPQRGR